MQALRKMFFGKCYLCEDEVYNPVVEHFKAHKGDKILMHSWNNLYYACDRCNSIKETEIDSKGLEILDCCDDSVDVFGSVKCLCASVPDGNFTVEPQYQDEKTVNTANLLYQCYNSNNTGKRGISREFLHEQIFEMYFKLIECRRTLKSRDALDSKKADAREHLRRMTAVSYPFSVFWKWHIQQDSFLKENINS
jgi:hypothetical protein